YFEYTADVDGDQTLDLDVPVGQVDDILMSLVVFDSAGSVANVELPGHDNTVPAFSDAPFGPEALDSPTAYLNALRGTEVTVQGPRPMTGLIVRAEPVTETIGKAATQRTRVTLLGTDGLEQFVLEDTDTVQVTDPALRSRIERALASLRNQSSQASRHLTIRLKGQGKRTVAVGYVAGAPLWKPTYRLLLPEGTATTARLQGWATLENQSGSDWKHVALTLQYGNPVTFRQALYRSYFVQRPEVPVEILGHVLPDIDTRARSMQFSMAAPAPAAAPPQAGMAGMEPMAKAEPMAPPAEAALAAETPEETTFTLAQPIDLAAGHSANVPILDREIPAARIALVPFLQPHPLAAVRITNNGDQSLPAGVLTLYDNGAGSVGFAGDARLGGLPPGETRLLSFARDLRTTVETTASPQPDIITAFSVAGGILTYTVHDRRIIHIATTAPAHESRDVMLEIPKSATDQTLTVDDGKTPIAEQTATAFRIALSLAPGETHTIVARLDHPVRQTVTLLTDDDDDSILQSIVGTQNLNPSGRTELRHILDLRQQAARKSADLDRQRKRLDDVLADEDRIRKNLGVVTATDALRSRLIRALDDNETTIEALRKSIALAETALAKAHQDLADAVSALRI
ncbi:DUF4139 domain-containing protein, partial [Acidisphaera sp. S103]|uniref:DUF4139 domain-containing protein n=1 Tax=Acidisphaera sp. S103 TaxID=1747223 RepID=UPI00131E2564